MPRKQLYSKVPVKKTGDANEKMKYEDKFVSVTTTPLIQLNHEKISKRFNLLSKTLLKHSIIWSKATPSEQIILKNYVQNYYDYYEFDQFDQSFELLPNLEVNLYTVSNEEIVYKSLNVFSGSVWPIRFHSKFVSKVTAYSANQIKYILSFVYLLAQGQFYGKQALAQSKSLGEFGYVVPVNGQSVPHNRFFYLKLFRQKNLLFSIGVEKKPILKGSVIKRYEYVNYILILDILSDQIVENPAKLEETVARFVQYIREDVAKKDHGEELIIQVEKNKKKKLDHLFEEVVNPYINQTQVFPTEFRYDEKYEYKPLHFKVNYVSLGDTSTVIFDKELKRWVTKDYLSQIEQRALNEYQRKVNQELIKRFVDFQSAKTLVELLTKIPNFKVQLTQQEKDVIGENGNVLVIGRSGTGKTTCAVLRLFAIEMLFKIRLSLSKKKHEGQLKDTKCSADDIDKTIGLHCVFLTASPVLTNQIERYYKKLTDNIKAELEKKKKRVEEQKRKQQAEKMKKKNISVEESADGEQTDPEKYEEIVEKDENIEAPESLVAKKSQQAIEEENQMNKELGDINLNEKIENEEFNEDQENFDQMKDDLDKKMKRFKSLYDLGEEDYPGFFTVKSYIMMIDGTLPKPFFIRKQADNNEQQSQATWHNEKKGVMMIENYYRNDEEEKDAIAQEEIEEEINYSDEEELQHEYLRQLQLRENREKQKLTDKLSKDKKSLSFEVDYDYFLTFFWPNVKHRYYSDRNITPHLVWTQIYSTIKGSANSHMYLGYYLTEKAYIEQSANSFLSKQQKLDVYETFCQYERWKIKSGGYDLMDSVNYILNYIRFKGYNGPDIHYVMIDEVQDLPHSIIYLLSKIAKYGVFYSGDTAQTIAKGIGFRFCDLKNLFDPKRFDQTLALQLQKPIVKQLTVNFRSHNNILQLANSVVSSIQILFPKTIDRLKKQISNISGPKPMILAEGDLELLFYVLCGEEKYKKQQGKDGMKKPPLEFGCDQVIIVRDQQSKNKIPTMLQHALCLTVYEAKGLEFNDVILFNFFSETKVANQWSLLKFLKIMVSEIDASEYEQSITKHQKAVPKQGEEADQVADVECIVEKNKNNNKLNIKKIVSDSKIYMKDINDYAELCSELKMLYTAITRPKNTLIIYDEDSTARKNIEKLWEKLDVIELISKQLLEEATKKSKPESQELKIFQSIVNTTDKSDWKKQGLKMYSRGYFEQAMKCFQRSENTELYKKAEANHIADHSTKKLIEIESERTAIKNKLIQYQKMSESEISKLKKRLKKEEAQTFTNFQSAGKIFEQLLMFKQAGQCFFSGRQFEKAYDNFTKAFMNRQAAQSLQMLNKFREASTYYEKEGLYLKAIQCLDMINEWESILKMIQKFSTEMSELEKKALIKKYSALALQQLMYEIEFENQVEQNKPENNRVQVIKQEENSEEEDWDSDEDPEIAAERSLSRKSSDNSMIASRKFSNISADESEPKRKQSLIEDEKVIKESVYENIQHEKQQIKDQAEKQPVSNPKADNSSFADLNESSSFADLNESSELERSKSLQSQDHKNIIQSVQQNTQQKEVQAQDQNKMENNESGSFANLNDSSFADLNSESSQNDINIKYPSELEPDIESIKSMVDPDDMWVQNALSEIAAKTNTEYSIIDEEQNYNSNVRIIKTKGNIIVQDKIMKKIISIVSIVNDSVEEFFKQFKGYQSLTSVSKAENEDTIDNRPEIEEFEEIDLKLINIILDILESFKLYKLCLFVCNRYHLPHKAGRYLVSMALKYSTNSQINNTLNPALIAPSLSRKLELEKGILASIALHAIFENVSADFLKVKVHQIEKEESKNSLGSYFIEGLILQGLYKKAVFMVNPEESLRILNNFRDFSLYQEVYKQKFLKKSSKEAAQFSAEAPIGHQQEQFCIVKLTENLNNYNILNRLETMSHRYYKQFNLFELKSKYVPEKLPSYAPLIQALLSEDKKDFTETVSSQISKYLQSFEKGPSYKLYEIVAFLTTLINCQSNYKYLFDLKMEPFLDVLALLRKIKKVLKKNNTSKSYEIIQAVFSVYFSRMIDPCKSMKFINDGFSLVHRSSIICNEFVQELKKNKSETAFFFEQDYNYIVVKTIKLIEIVSKRFDLAYSKFLRTRAQLDEYQQKLKQGFMHSDFNELQSEYLLKAMLREQVRSMYPKDKRVRKQASKTMKKKDKPNFNFKSQGRPELVVYLNQSQSQEIEEVEQKKIEHHNLFIFPDLNPKFKSFSDILLSAYEVKRQENKSGKTISGRLLYCGGLNDSFKQFTQKREDDPSVNLYNAIQYRKFNRLDMYADNLLSVIQQLGYTERHYFSAQILILLMVQYRILVNGKNFKLQVFRKFLKFFQNLKLIEIIGAKEQVLLQNVNDYLSSSQTCAFSYFNHFSCELEAKDVADLISQFLDILRAEKNYHCFNVDQLIMLIFVNIPNNQRIFQALRDFAETAAYAIKNPFLDELKSCESYEQMMKLREKLLKDREPYLKDIILHEIRVTDSSDIDKNIQESEIDYQIKEKILQARIKAVSKIGIWWRSIKSKVQPHDQIQIVRENRIVKMTYGIKYVPIDDRFILRSSTVRQVLFSFYLNNIVTSSLDFHFILMTLNKISNLRREYINAYSTSKQALVELNNNEIDFEQEILNIEDSVKIWKNDEKWLKDRNIDLKRKKVFEVKWMTKNVIGSLAKRRAGLNKQKKLQDKKKFLKKFNL